ncbi:unnamed protein product [Prunus armeniaca]
MSQGGQFIKYALLNVTPIPLPTLGDSRSEISVPYSPHRVRRQFGHDQGVPSSPNHADPFALHRVFWSNDLVLDNGGPFVLASRGRVGGFPSGYQAYWNRCLASFREFQSFPGDRLPHTTARLAGLVLEEKAIPLSQKRNLPFISKSGDIVGEFPKASPKPGTQSPYSPGNKATPVFGKRKQEEKQDIRKGQIALKARKFIPKVAPSGPPRTKEETLPERPQPSKPTASKSQGRAGKVLEITPLRKMGTSPKRKRSGTTSVSPHAAPKHRSMRVLQERFTGARTSDIEASETRTVVTIDDDSDDGDTTESEASVLEQEDVDNIGDLHEGSDKNDNYDHDGVAFVPFDDYTEEQGSSNTFSGSAGSSVRPIGTWPILNSVLVSFFAPQAIYSPPVPILQVTDIAEDSNLVMAIIDPAQSAPEIGHVAQNMEIVPVVAPSFDTLDTLVKEALAESSPTIENFVFRPYGTLVETFTFVPFYSDVSDTVEVPAAMSQGGQFIKYALLNVTPIPLPTLGDSRLEISVPYSPHRVRRQFGLDQGVPSSPNHADSFVLHRVFWNNDHVPDNRATQSLSE